MIRQKRKRQEAEIREFVYLNETSVESLLASTDGEILVETNRSTSKSRDASITGSVNGLFGEAQYSPTLKRSHTTTGSELRKSVAQSAFARFRRRNQDQFRLRPLDVARTSRRVGQKLSERDPRTLRRLKQGVPVRELRRGDLLEIDAAVTAADIFKARTAMISVAEVVEAYPSFLTVEQRDAFKAARPLTELIDRLNGNTIPVKGETGLSVTEISGAPWLLLGAEAHGRPVQLDSALQAQWLWGDAGRILFEEHRFRLLCRVVNPSLETAPASTYVGTILRSIDPALSHTIDGLGGLFLGSLRDGHERARDRRGPGDRGSDAVRWYAEELAREAGTQLSVEALGALSAVHLGRLDMHKQIEVLDSIDLVVLGADASCEAEVRASLRDRMRTEFALWPWSKDANEPKPEPTSAPATNYLRVEIVAVYW